LQGKISEITFVQKAECEVSRRKSLTTKNAAAKRRFNNFDKLESQKRQSERHNGWLSSKLNVFCFFIFSGNSRLSSSGHELPKRKKAPPANCPKTEARGARNLKMIVDDFNFQAILAWPACGGANSAKRLVRPLDRSSVRGRLCSAEQKDRSAARPFNARPLSVAAS